MSKERKMCIEEDCYGMVDMEFVEHYKDGTPHPRAMKCWKCRTARDGKLLKRFRKDQRKKGHEPLKALKK